MTKIPSDFCPIQYQVIKENILLNRSEEEIKSYFLKDYVAKKGNIPYLFKHVGVIIYSGGKTASATLTQSFKQYKKDFGYTIHAHRDHGCQLSLGDLINNTPERKNKILIISVYREPISQRISIFFQNIDRQFGQPISEIVKLPLSKIIDKFNESFNRNFLPYRHPHMYGSPPHFGTNILDQPFDKMKGFQIYETATAKIIMLRFDGINQWEEILRKSLNYPNFKLINHNLTKDKPVNDLYRQFLENIYFSKQTLDRLFELEKVNLEYFYTPEEITAIKAKWYSRVK